MSINLPDLPYAKDALEPYISARTLEFHHGKHHQAYIDKTNQMIEGTDLAGQELEAIIKSAAGSGDQGLFNNAAQALNHDIFWHSMTPGGGGKPTGLMASKIDAAFGSYEKFVEEFKNAAVTQFGSGWAWLVQRGDGLAIVQTPNANTPVTGGEKPLLVVDVWEHAYYLDYQNRRPDFVQAFLDHLVNWDYAYSNMI